jgi:hypothetical protein
MKTVLALFLIVCATATSQTQTSGKAKTAAPCSPAVSGNNNKLTITCTGVSDKVGSQLVDLMNKIATNQIDAQAVLSKLDSCLVAVNAVKENQKAWTLSDDQKKRLHDLLKNTKGKVTVNVLPSDHNASLMGADLYSVLKDANWDVGSCLNNDFTLPAGVVGVVLVVTHADFPEAVSLENALRAVGIDAEHFIDEKKVRTSDPTSIYIAIGTKPQVPVPMGIPQ